MRKRLLLVVPLTILLTAIALEAVARHLRLDLRQGQAIAVASGQAAKHPELGGGGGAGGVDYLPRDYSMDASGFTSIWGRCDFGHPGPSVLVMGDSTTRQTSDSGTSGEPARNFDDLSLTWPALLRQRLGAEVQVCVLAEDGYHPHDLALLAPDILEGLQPVATLYLLCQNDLQNLPRRVLVPGPEGTVLHYQAPRHTLIWAPLYNPWLQAHSEAFRFLHWRLAQGSERAHELPVEESKMDPSASLRRLRDVDSALHLLFLPPVEEQPSPQAERQLQALERAAGVAVTRVALSSPIHRLRRQPSDSVHINELGHTDVVDAALQVLNGTVPLK